MSDPKVKARIKINKLLEEDFVWHFFDSQDGKADIFLWSNVKFMRTQL